MSPKANGSNAQLNQIEALIAVLKTEREGLERRFSLIRGQQDFLDTASSIYIDLWRLKWEAGLEILELSPVQRQSLEKLPGHDAIAQHREAIEDQLSRLISEGRYLTFAEIEGVLPIIDSIIDSMENLREQFAKRERSALQRAKNLATKTIRVSGATALIALDLPVQNWQSVVYATLLILPTSLNDK